jgi:hypothetical protein
LPYKIVVAAARPSWRLNYCLLVIGGPHYLVLHRSPTPFIGIADTIQYSTGDFDPSDRERVFAYLHEHQAKGEIVTGLLYIDETAPELHELSEAPDEALIKLPFEKLCPGSAKLEALPEEFR